MSNSDSSFFEKVLGSIKEPSNALLYLSRNGFMKWMPDERYLKLLYKTKMHKPLNLDRPETFTEKMQWLKLHDRKPEYRILVNKATVKEYVANVIGQKYIIPTIGRWTNVDEIDFASLPNSFVLKVNHDSGGVIICKDKEKLDIEVSKSKLAKCLKNNGFWYGREWPYKDLSPCVIAEEYMEDENTKELRDYKFFCFDGKVKCFKVDYDRFVLHRANYFDPDGNLLPFGEVAYPNDPDKKIVLPDTIREMEELAELLSKGFPFLRVDFYDVNEKVYFGELTFYPASGFGPFTSDEWDLKLGQWIKLPMKRK